MENPDQLRDENRRLQRAVDELSILNELAAAIGALNDPQEIIRKILARSLRAVDAEQGVLSLIEERPSLPMKTLVRTSISSSTHQSFHFSEALLGWMVLNKKPLTINSPSADERFRGLKWDCAVQSVLCVPMLIRSCLKGVLTVYNKKGETGFTDDDQRLLAIIASQSAQVVENARLFEEERSLILMRQELKLASQIQRDLLPKEPPHHAGYDMAGATFPARAVGGDYFDFVPLDEHKVAVCVADISGKGLPAALLMANLQASLHGITNTVNRVKDCVARLNQHLYRSTGSEKFATLFYATLDTVSHELTYCNAGHEPPLLFTGRGEPKLLREGGTVIGISDLFPFEEATVRLEPGDVMVVYSDGITEAMNPLMEQFGEESLVRLVKQEIGSSSDELIGKILEAVKTHAGEAPQHDDITALVVRRQN